MDKHIKLFIWSTCFSHKVLIDIIKILNILLLNAVSFPVLFPLKILELSMQF